MKLLPGTGELILVYYQNTEREVVCMVSMSIENFQDLWHNLSTLKCDDGNE
jgi:hypothetical protein